MSRFGLNCRLSLDAVSFRKEIGGRLQSGPFVADTGLPRGCALHTFPMGPWAPAHLACWTERPCHGFHHQLPQATKSSFQLVTAVHDASNDVTFSVLEVAVLASQRSVALHQGTARDRVAGDHEGLQKWRGGAVNVLGKQSRTADSWCLLLLVGPLKPSS
jgi:hypothetical protein